MSLVILTGANRGLGLEIARALAAQGRPLALVCRGREAGERTLAELRALPGSGELTLVQADLLDPDAIRAAARALAELGPIGAIIHNAGLWPTRLELDRRGVERSFAVNHLAPFHMNALLWPRLREDGARVVQVSAGLIGLARRDLEAIVSGSRFSSFRTYADTKRLNAVSTAALARRVAGGRVRVNAVHPGVLRTGLGEGDGHWLNALVRPLKSRWRAPETGAAGPVRLAVAPEMAAVHGRFFDELREVPWPGEVEGEAEAAALWSLSERLCELSFAP